MFHPEDRVFLLWKPMSGQEIGELKTAIAGALKSDASGSGYLKGLASGSGALTKGSWLWLSAYGID